MENCRKRPETKLKSVEGQKFYANSRILQEKSCLIMFVILTSAYAFLIHYFLQWSGKSKRNCFFCQCIKSFLMLRSKIAIWNNKWHILSITAQWSEGVTKPSWSSEQIEVNLRFLGSFLGSFLVYFYQKNVFKHL